jgi:hypothetical protein
LIDSSKDFLALGSIQGDSIVLYFSSIDFSEEGSKNNATNVQGQ